MADKKLKEEKAKEKTPKGDGQTAKKPCKPSNEQTVVQTDPQIIALLKSMQETLKKQDDKMDGLSSRLDQMESDLSYDDRNYGDGFYDDSHYEEGELDDSYHPSASCSTVGSNEATLSTSKRPAEDRSRFESLAKKFRKIEHVDAEIDEALAENINELFRKGTDEERYEELVKDETNPRPGNCPGLSVVRTNRLIWDAVSHRARITDKKLQNVETSVVKAGTILVKSVNEMAGMESQFPKLSPIIDQCNKVLALLGHTSVQINLTRRDLLKPDLKEEYAHLCNHAVPFTTELFGDDVSKQAKEIEDSNKIGNRLQKGSNYSFRGRSGPQFRGRARGRGWPSRGRPYGSGYSLHGMGQSQSFGQSKNYVRRGPVGRPPQK